MKNEKGSVTCQRYIRGSQSVLCCQRFKKLKNKNKDKRGQEEDILCAMKYPPNSKLLQHTCQSQAFVNCFPSLPLPLTLTFSVSGEPENWADVLLVTSAGPRPAWLTRGWRGAPRVWTWRGAGLWGAAECTVSLSAPKVQTQSCFPLGVCRKHKVVMPKVVLSVKQPVKLHPVFSHKVFHFTFYGKPREKHIAIHSNV